MNQGEIITQIGYGYRTASRNFVTADEIKSRLNRSLDKLSGQVNVDNTALTTTITFTGNGTYALPSDFKSPISLYDPTNMTRYGRVSLSEFSFNNLSGVPLYAIKGTSSINIEGPQSSATLTLTYWSTKDAYDATLVTPQKGLTLATDIPALQARFHDYYVFDVLAGIFFKERKFDDYRTASAEKNLILKDIINENQANQEEKVVHKVVPYNTDYA